MTQALTASELASMEQLLRERLRELDRRRDLHDGGETRAEHAREVLLQDGDDAPQRDAEREVDLALSDREIAEIGAVSLALQRLQSGEYGACVDCGSDIPFARLQLEPQALRCVDCESAYEKVAARGAHTTSM